MIAKLSDIYFKEKNIAKIVIVMSLERVKKQALYQIYGTIALIILIMAAIWLTSIFVTRRYISTPLKKLHPFSHFPIYFKCMDDYKRERERDSIKIPS